MDQNKLSHVDVCFVKGLEICHKYIYQYVRANYIRSHHQHGDGA